MGITGVIGPDPSGAFTPGTINVALYDGALRTSSVTFPTMPAEVKRWAMITAIDLVRLQALGITR